MDLGLTDRRFLVCGASRGLGRGRRPRAGRRGRAGRRSRPDRRRTSPRSRRTPAAWWSRVDLSSADGPATAVRDAVGALGGLDGLLVNSGGPPPGHFAEHRRGGLGEGHRRHAPEHAPADPRGAAAPARGSRPVDRDHPVVVGPRADPGADDVERAAAGPGGPDQVARRRRSPRSASTASLPAGSARSGSASSTRSAPPTPGRRSRRSSGRRSAGSRSAGTATPTSSAAWRRSCSRRRPRT